MAAKGDKARLYDVALRMYTEGKSLTDIEAVLGVSRQTLGQWKADTRRPGEELDEWDRGRRQKASNVARLRNLFDRELTALEESAAGSLNNVSLDALAKLGTLVQRWEAAERAPSYDRPRVFLENLQWIAGWLKQNDPAGLSVLADNLDAMTVDFKAQVLGEG